MLDKFFPLYIFVFFLTASLTIIFERILIPYLSKNAKQPIYEGGPAWHMKKSGTPTMGGVAFLASATLAIGICAMFLGYINGTDSFYSLITTLLYATLNSSIGVIDDLKKLKNHKNKGLTPKEKLAFQLACAVLFLIARRLLLNDGTEISFSFGEINLSFLYYPISILILLGITNCANLTDGIDGLATSVAFSIGISLMYISAALNTEVGVISSAIIGMSVGFLFFNLYPAKIFMGDTGSLFFGSIIAASSFMLKNPLIIIFVAGVYVIEGLSVILQVTVYKISKKRILKMAPLHHHFEKNGWSENKICISAILTTFIMSLPAYIFYLP